MPFGDIIDDESSENEETKDRLIIRWKQSHMNHMSEQFIKQRGVYLWAFGENEKRALAVQRKDKQINGPLPSCLPLENNDYIVSIATADEHSACVTEMGRIYTTGHNQH